MNPERKELSFWEKDAFAGLWDFVVVGAGVTGLHAAIELKRLKPSLRILLLESRPVGAVASTRNAGFLCLGSPSELAMDRHALGDQALTELISAKWSGIERTLQLFGGKALSFKRVQGHELFVKDDATAFLRSGLERELVLEALPELNRLVAEAVRLPRPGKSLRRRRSSKHADRTTLPAPYFGAVQALTEGPWGPLAHSLIPLAWEGQVQPFVVREALIRYALNLGIRYQVGATVQAVPALPLLAAEGPLPSYELDCSFGDKSLTIKLKNIVCATNALTQLLLPRPSASEAKAGDTVSPKRGQMWYTAPLKGSVIRHLQGNFHGDRGYLYFRQAGDRFLLGGGRNVDFETESTDAWAENPLITQYLKSYATQVLGLPEDLPWEGRWSGTMGFTTSGIPVVQSPGRGVWVVAGMNGMGMALGPEMGRMVACRALAEYQG